MEVKLSLLFVMHGVFVCFSVVISVVCLLSLKLKHISYFMCTVVLTESAPTGNS